MSKEQERPLSELIEAEAEDHADSRCPEQGDEFIVWCMCRDDFTAGASFAIQLAKAELAREVMEKCSTQARRITRPDSLVYWDIVIRMQDLEEILSKYMEGK